MSEHDSLCCAPQYWHSPGTPMATCQCDLIAKVRADEREFLAPEVPMARDDLRNELRAKVQALLDETERGAWDRRDALELVLRLIDGSSE
jgi:hypothetical protein